VAVIAEMLQEIVSDKAILMDHSSKSYTRFIPRTWDDLPRAGEGWTPTKRMLLFEFDLAKSGLAFKLVLGPGEETERARLHRIITSRAAVFNKATTRLYPKWWSCHIEKWLSANQLEESELGDLRIALSKRFEEFKKERLPLMESAIRQG
jgi:hypothetical protein